MEAKDYFNDLVTINPTLIAFITVFVFGSLLSLLTLYSIIWFEHFGSDCQRTIANQMISGICWTFIQLSLLPQLIDFMR
jgi:hypothetical protein